MPTYTVLISDNFHHMDTGEQYKHGDFDTCEAAIAASKRIVDDFLLQYTSPPRPHDELWSLFTTFGDDPFIVTTDPACRFSAWEYARQRCKELAQSNQ